MRARGALSLFIAVLVAASCQRERVIGLDGGQDTKGAGDAMVDEDGAVTDDSGMDAGTPDGAAPSGDAGPDAGDDAGWYIAPLDAGPDAGPEELPWCGAPEPTVQAGPDPGMVLVPEGPFWRGCSPWLTSDFCGPDLSPGRCITLSTFEIDVLPVTTSQYETFAADAGWPMPDCGQNDYPNTLDMPDGPVQCIQHDEAEAYCESLGKRLPTEAEFEKAGRGTDARNFPWGNDPAPSCDVAPLEGCTSGYSDVGEFMAGDSPYGAADLTSNGGEWTADWYDYNYYSYAPNFDPPGPASSPEGAYSTRGQRWNPAGTFSPPSAGMEIWYRDDSNEATPGLGFRCAKSLTR